MNIKRRIKKACRNVPIPSAEKVLPSEALEATEEPFRSHRGVIYAVATACVCLVIALTVFFQTHKTAPIADGSTETGTPENTTCEEVYVYVPKSYYDDAMAENENEDPVGDTSIVEDPYGTKDYYENSACDTAPEEPETEKVVLITSEGKHLVQIQFVRPTKNEVRQRFKEVYGFEYEMYWNDDRLKKEVIPKMLGREYQEGDEKNEEVIAAKMKVAADLTEISWTMSKEIAEKVLEDCGYDFEDVYRFCYLLDIYVDEKDIETIRNHELVTDVMTGERLYDFLTTTYEDQ